MLYLTQKLILNVHPGDRFEISIVKTATGEPAIGIAGLKSKQYRKVIVGAGGSAPYKSVSQNQPERPSSGSPISFRSRKRLK